MKGLISKSGNIIHYLNGEYHREDGPATIYTNGDKRWYKNGKLHREDGPAIEYANGSKSWYKNDDRHREDGPAIEYANGHKEWYKNDLLHREDGPAIERINGNNEYARIIDNFHVYFDSDKIRCFDINRNKNFEYFIKLPWNISKERFVKILTFL